MKEKLEKNLDAVRGEAMSMLDTLKAVRGETYGEMVRMLLNIGQVAQLTRLLLEFAGREDDRVVKMAGLGMEKLLAEIAISGAVLGKFNTDDWESVMKDADLMRDSVEGLIGGALDAAENGKEFGDDAR